MAKKQWITVYEDYSGLYYRKLATNLYHFVEYTDMDDACGRDNEGHPKYHVQLKEVDLDAIPQKTLDAALNSCGMEYRELQMAQREEVLAGVCQSYGAYAPMWQGSSNNLSKLLREARRESRALSADPQERESRLTRPVNAIGSSALEYMQGDISSALCRGVVEGNQETTLVAKMYGITKENITVSPSPCQVSLGGIPSDDPLAYMSGYMTGSGGRPMKDNKEELADSYIQGYRMGVEVRTGAKPQPSWVK